MADRTPFDSADPRDARSEKARQFLVSAFSAHLDEIDAPDGEAIQDIAAGMMVGFVCIIMAQSDHTDENHKLVRNGLMQITPWAVDQARSILGLPPLPEAKH